MQETCQKWLRIISSIYLYVMFSAFLLWMPLGFYVGITFTKFLVFSIATCVYLFAVIISRCVFAMEGYNFSGSWARTTAAQKWFGIFVLVMLFSAVFSPYKTQMLLGAGRYEGLLTWLLYIAAFFLVSRYTQITKWHLVTFVSTVSLICLIAILQYYGSTIFYPAGSNYFTTRFLSTLGNVNMVSGMLCLAFPLCIVAFMRLEGWLRWLFLLPLFLCTFLQCAIDVESGQIGFLLILILLIPLCFRSLEHLKSATVVWAVASFAGLLQSVADNHNGVMNVTKSFPAFLVLFIVSLVLLAVVWTIGKYFRVKHKMRAAAITMAMITIIGVFVVVVNPGKQQQGMVYEASQVVRGNWDDSFGSNRVFLWKRTMPLTVKRPFFGSGPDSFRWEFMNTYGEEVRATNPRIYYDNAHNEYLQITVNYGWIGLIVYLIAVGCALFINRKKYRNPLLESCFYAVLCYLIQAFFSFSVPILAPLLWVFLGICDSQTKQKALAEGD